MLKKTIFISLSCWFVLLFALPLQAGDDDKTGVVEDNTYTDSRFGFQIHLPDDWKVGKPKKEINQQRIVAEKKNPRIPPQLRDDPSWATPPSLMIFADSTDLTRAEFFAFLQSDTTKSDFKKQIQKNTVLMDLYGRYQFDIIFETPISLAGLPTTQYKMRRKYEAQGMQLGSDRAMTIKDFVSGYVYLVEGDGWIGYIELVCENQFLPVLEETFAEIMKTFKFPAAAEPQDTLSESEPTEG